MTSRAMTSQQLPRLENCDRVTRDEFERRYHHMGNVKKAELMAGTVYSPLKYQQHGQLSAKRLLSK